MSITQQTSSTPSLARADAERRSIGHLQPGQDFFRLYSGKLRWQGTVVAVRPAHTAGYDLIVSKDGQTRNTWGGAATQFYVAKEATNINPGLERAEDGLPTLGATAALIKELQAEDNNNPVAESTEKEAKAMASKTESKAQAPAEPQVDLIKELLEQLSTEGVKPQPRWSPSKKYATLVVDGSPIGAVFAQTKTGIKVKVALSLTDLGRAKKDWKDNAHESNPYGVLGFFATPAQVKVATAALVLSAQKQADARQAKLDAAKAKADAAKKAKQAKEAKKAKEAKAKKAAADKAKKAAAKDGKKAAPRKRTGSPSTDVTSPELRADLDKVADIINAEVS